MKELLKKVRKLEIKTRRLVDSTFAGEYHSAFKGQGLEFDEVRPYQFGDDIRTIDWNVTAKTGEPFIKQFKEEREQTLFVLFDISGSEDFGQDDENKLMIGAELTAIFAFSAMKNNDKFGLITFTDEIERFYAPKKGRKHVLAALRGLLNHQPESPRTSVREAVDYVRKVLRRRSVVIVISDFLDEGYAHSIQHLARKHELILIRLFNPQEIIQKSTGIIPVYDSESRRMTWINSGDMRYRQQLGQKFVDIHSRLEDLSKRHGIDYLSLSTASNYIVELEKFFRKRNARKRAR